MESAPKNSEAILQSRSCSMSHLKKEQPLDQEFPSLGNEIKITSSWLRLVFSRLETLFPKFEIRPFP